MGWAKYVYLANSMQRQQKHRVVPEDVTLLRTWVPSTTQAAQSRGSPVCTLDMGARQNNTKVYDT